MKKTDQYYGIRALIFYILIIIGLAFYADTAESAEVVKVENSNSVLFYGTVEPGDLEKLNAFLEGSEDLTVILMSGGGDVKTGVDLALAIHKAGASTLVTPSGKCLSICSVMWTAGKHRKVLGTGQLGVHRMYTSVAFPEDMTKEEVEQNSQHVVGYVLYHTLEFGIPQYFFAATFLTPSESMYIFPREDLDKLER